MDSAGIHAIRALLGEQLATLADCMREAGWTNMSPHSLRRATMQRAPNS